MVQTLQNLCKKYRSDFGFLAETKQQSLAMEKKRRRFSFDSSFYVPPQGLSGGLSLWWTSNYKVHILSFNSNFMHLKYMRHNNDVVFMTFVYGPPNRQDRDRFPGG